MTNEQFKTHMVALKRIFDAINGSDSSSEIAEINSQIDKVNKRLEKIDSTLERIRDRLPPRQ